MPKSQVPGEKPVPPDAPEPVIEFSDAEVDEIIGPLIEPFPAPWAERDLATEP